MMFKVLLPRVNVSVSRCKVAGAAMNMNERPLRAAELLRSRTCSIQVRSFVPAGRSPTGPGSPDAAMRAASRLAGEDGEVQGKDDIGVGQIHAAEWDPGSVVGASQPERAGQLADLTRLAAAVLGT